MTFLFFDGLALAEPRGFRFEGGLLPDFEAVVGFGDEEGEWDAGGGDGGLEEGATDASAAAFAALRAATALSIPCREYEHKNGKQVFLLNNDQLRLVRCDAESLYLIHRRLHNHVGILVLYPMTTPLDRNHRSNLWMSWHQF